MEPTEPAKSQNNAPQAPISGPMLAYLRQERRQTRSRLIVRLVSVIAAIVLGVFGGTFMKGYALGTSAVATLIFLVAAVDWLIERLRTRVPGR